MLKKLLINSCNKKGKIFTSNMHFRMSSDDTVTCVSGEGPGPSPGGIAGHTNADQTSEGPSLKTGRIAGSAVTGKGIKRRLNVKSYEVKYDTIVNVERGGKTRKQIAFDFGIPTSTLSTWIKNSDEIKKKYLSGEMGSQRKKCAMLVLALQNFTRVVSLSSLNKLHFRYFRSFS
jgi:hypothetical protein